MGNTSRVLPFNHVDFLRMAMIVIVVLCHIVRFTEHYPWAKEGLLTLVMPCFLFVTAALVNVDKQSKDFVRYLLRILLPYITMVLGFALLSLYLPVRGGLHELSVSELTRVVFIDSIGPYWFLHTLVVCGAVYYLVYRGLSACAPLPRFLVFFSLLLALAMLTPILSLRHAVYYAMGVALRQSGVRLSSLGFGSVWAMLPMLLLMIDPAHWEWLDFRLALASVCFFLFFNGLYAKQNKDNVLFRHLCFLGRNTLPIYLFHPIFTMVGKYLSPLFAFDTTSLLHAAAVTLLSVYGSLCLAWILDRFSLSRLWLSPGILR